MGLLLSDAAIQLSEKKTLVTQAEPQGSSSVGRRADCRYAAGLLSGVRGRGRSPPEWDEAATAGEDVPGGSQRRLGQRRGEDGLRRRLHGDGNGGRRVVRAAVGSSFCGSYHV